MPPQELPLGVKEHFERAQVYRREGRLLVPELTYAQFVWAVSLNPHVGIFLISIAGDNSVSADCYLSDTMGGPGQGTPYKGSGVIETVNDGGAYDRINFNRNVNGNSDNWVTLKDYGDIFKPQGAYFFHGSWNQQYVFEGWATYDLTSGF